MILTAGDRLITTFRRGKKMETKVRKKIPHQSVEEVTINSTSSYDFELWAKAVKRQMIAALSKKGDI
jgi:hypothetical protein